MIRRPPRSTLDRSSAASDVYKRQINDGASDIHFEPYEKFYRIRFRVDGILREVATPPVSYTHLRAHETVLDLVCRLLLETKNKHNTTYLYNTASNNLTSTVTPHTCIVDSHP